MKKHLFGLLHHLGVLFEDLAAELDVGAEPGVRLVDLPVEDEGVDDAKGELYQYP
jgi:hypothetical protein